METKILPEQPNSLSQTPRLKIVLYSLSGVILLGISFFAGYWYASQKASSKTPEPKTPTPTSSIEKQTKDWETYANSEYGYSFKYPRDWEVSDERSGISSELLSITQVRNKDVTATFTVIITTESADSILSTLRQYAPKPEAPISIGAVDGQKITTITGAGSSDYNTSVLLSKGRYTYRLDALILNEESVKDEYLPMIDRILQTFQFTTDETANWEIYTNSTDHYSLAIPNNWFSDEKTATGLRRVTYFGETGQKGEDFITVGVENNPNKLSIQEWVEREYQEVTGGAKPETDTLKYTDITVGGVDASKVAGLPARFADIHIFIPYKGKMFVISGITDPTFGKDKFFNQILSTFKFLD